MTELEPARCAVQVMLHPFVDRVGLQRGEYAFALIPCKAGAQLYEGQDRGDELTEVAGQGVLRCV